jgi:AhpD family alkylhydroperoxidase
MARIGLPGGDGPEVIRALSYRPRLAGAVDALDQAVWQSGLDWRLHELVRMRVAQINQCTVCLDWRTPAAVDAGATEDLLGAVADYRNHPGFTDAERVAIEYAERYCMASADIDDELFTRLHRHFDDGEIVELTLVISKYLALGRVMQVLDLDQRCSLQPADVGRGLGATDAAR